MFEQVTFVCVGNICRSPLAVALFQRRAREAGLQISVDSAATSGWHSGEPADARAIVAARGHDLDITSHAARLLRPEEFMTSQLIVAMDQESLEGAMSIAPPIATDVEITLMSRFASEPIEADIPDPYYSGRFDPMIAMLDDCMPGLIAYLKGAQ